MRLCQYLIRETVLPELDKLLGRFVLLGQFLFQIPIDWILSQSNHNLFVFIIIIKF
jgi:hypothetical protein